MLEQLPLQLRQGRDVGGPGEANRGLDRPSFQFDPQIPDLQKLLQADHRDRQRARAVGGQRLLADELKQRLAQRRHADAQLLGQRPQQQFLPGLKPPGHEALPDHGIGPLVQGTPVEQQVFESVCGRFHGGTETAATS